MPGLNLEQDIIGQVINPEESYFNKMESVIQTNYG